MAEAVVVARARLDFTLWAFVFMPEHVHVIVRPRRPDYEISAILKAIKEPVGRLAIKHIPTNGPPIGCLESRVAGEVEPNACFGSRAGDSIETFSSRIH